MFICMARDTLVLTNNSVKVVLRGAMYNTRALDVVDYQSNNDLQEVQDQ